MQNIGLITCFLVAWNESTTKERKNIVQQACNSLDLTNENERLSFARCLVYISLGKENYITDLL